MALFDEIVSGIEDAFFQEGDSWIERIGNANITFISPETSTEFVAKWINSNKGANKKLGLFDYPNIQGTVAQDFLSSSNRLSIVFRFTDYKNNDLFARDFYAVSTKERGRWTVIHPVYGRLGLQLISIQEFKTSSEGGYTEVSTEWIESITEDELLTDRELAGLVDGQCSIVQLNSIEQFVKDCDQTGKKLRAAIENTVEGIQNVVDFVLSPLFAVENLVESAVRSTNLLISGSLDAALLPLTELAGQIQNLVNLPLLATKDTKARIAKYKIVRWNLASLLPGENPIITRLKAGGDPSNPGVSPSDSLSDVNKNVIASSVTETWSTDLEKRNNIATAELASISSIVAFSQILLTADDIFTRSKALDLSQQLIYAFSDLVYVYDKKQEEQESARLEDQYFSNSVVFNDLVLLVSLTLQYMQSLLGTFKIEKRITIKDPIPTVRFCIEEYGTIDKYDELIESNNLKSSEIIWLPSGKEIVVYV